MAARTKARKAALDLLFEADQRGVNVSELLGQRLAEPAGEAPVREYTASLVRGTVEHWVAINELITTWSQGWTIDRMPAVDRAILRLGTFEVLHSEDVPEPVAINAVLAEPAKWNGKTVKVSGQVGAVCQKKGCWMTLGTGEPGGKSVRISFKDYGFFVPKDCIGRQATVEGEFAVSAPSAAQAQHDAKESVKPGQTPPPVAVPREVLALVATGVDLR